jgi:hypothetical protein
VAIRAKSSGAVLGAACALALGVSGTASADAYTWRSYTRDGSWNCGQAGSTKQVGNLYVLACVKVVYGDWQPVLIVTATSSGGYIDDDQIGAIYTNGVESAFDGYCGGWTASTYIPPNTSLARFSPTTYTPNALVDAEFLVTVNHGSAFADLYSP